MITRLDDFINENNTMSIRDKWLYDHFKEDFLEDEELMDLMSRRVTMSCSEFSEKMEGKDIPYEIDFLCNALDNLPLKQAFKFFIYIENKDVKPEYVLTMKDLKDYDRIDVLGSLIETMTGCDVDKKDLELLHEIIYNYKKANPDRDPNKKIEYETPHNLELIDAINQANFEKVKNIISIYPDWVEEGQYGHKDILPDFLVRAIYRGNIEIVDYLLSEFENKPKDWLNICLLYSMFDQNMLRTFLNKGADPTKPIEGNELEIAHLKSPHLRNVFNHAYEVFNNIKTNTGEKSLEILSTFDILYKWLVAKKPEKLNDFKDFCPSEIKNKYYNDNT
jgi:hypothetical protein